MENIVDNYLDMLSFINEGEIIIGEGFIDIVKKFDPRRLKSLIPDIKSAYENKDSKKLYKIVKAISPEKVPIEKIEKLAEKIPGYQSTFPLANKVLKNTYPEANQKLMKAMAIMISVKSAKSENPIKETKTMLKKVAFKINNELDKNNNEDDLKIPKGTLIDEVVGWVYVSLIIALFSGGSLLLATSLGIWPTVWILIFIFGAYYIINLHSELEKNRPS